MTRQAVGPAFLALLFMVTAIPSHAGVYKWVDEDGRAHYTDQPPDQGEHTQLKMPAAPVPAAPIEPQDGSAESRMQSARQRHQKLMEEEERSRKEADAKQEQERLAAQDKARADRHNDELRKSMDDALMAECMRNREIYCDQGVEKIKKEKEMRNLEYQMRQEWR